MQENVKERGRPCSGDKMQRKMGQIMPWRPMSVQGVRDCEGGGKKKETEDGCDCVMRAPNICIQQVASRNGGRGGKEGRDWKRRMTGAREDGERGARARG
jgi:hypothetical protein